MGSGGACGAPPPHLFARVCLGRNAAAREAVSQAVTKDMIRAVLGQDDLPARLWARPGPGVGPPRRLGGRQNPPFSFFSANQECKSSMATRGGGGMVVADSAGEKMAFRRLLFSTGRPE